MAEKQLSKDEVAAHRKAVCSGCSVRTFKSGMLYCNTARDMCRNVDSCPSGKWRH